MLPDRYVHQNWSIRPSIHIRLLNDDKARQNKYENRNVGMCLYNIRTLKLGVIQFRQFRCKVSVVCCI